MTPLSVIGGFLGAGKTTLINHLLRIASCRYGVLVNDFGSINIDAALIATETDGVVALTNGCVCCELGADLGAALHRLAARAPDHILIEASGVADPWRIAQLALVEPGFGLQPLVVLVDAAAIAAQLADRWIADTVAQQLRHAELIVLTRTDLARAPSLRDLAPAARVVAAPHGTLDPALLSFPTTLTPTRFSADTPSHGFRSWSSTDPTPFDRHRLRTLLATLPPSVLRLKGFCRVDNDPPTLLQFAAGRWAFHSAPPAAQPGLIAIGTDDMQSLDREVSKARALPSTRWGRTAPDPAT